jgi:hypothetical protein
MSMVQYGLWPNCTNQCDFCLLLDKTYKSEQERLNMLSSIKENIKHVDWANKFSSGISLIGGEIYYTDSQKVKKSFLELIEQIIAIIIKPNKTAIYSTVTNGIYDSTILLEPTLDLFKKHEVLDQVDISFSWDLKYRFHTEESKACMIKNVNLVNLKYGLFPTVQTCLTQYLIDAHLNGEFNLKEYQEENFPNTRLALLYPHKINTGKKLDDFFFKRDSLFKFIKYLKSTNQNELIQQLIQAVVNSSQFKYTGLWERNSLYGKNKTSRELYQSPTLENKQVLTDCGHSELYRCYTDSDKCLLCDLLKVI